MRCNLKIGIGAVVPHPDTGFGGGGKIILPGVSTMETTAHFHSIEKQYKRKYPDRQDIGFGLFDNNPLQQNIAEATALAGLDIKTPLSREEEVSTTNHLSGTAYYFAATTMYYSEYQVIELKDFIVAEGQVINSYDQLASLVAQVYQEDKEFIEVSVRINICGG